MIDVPRSSGAHTRQSLFILPDSFSLHVCAPSFSETVVRLGKQMMFADLGQAVKLTTEGGDIRHSMAAPGCSWKDLEIAVKCVINVSGDWARLKPMDRDG